MKSIPLTQNLSAIVDDEDFQHLNRFRWYAKKHRRTFYAVRNVRIHPGYGGQRQLKMHSEIAGDVTPPLQYDHIDGNGLNNLRSNLRVVSPRENCQNLHVPKTSRFPGVSFLPGRNKPWVAHIWYGSNTQKTLGYFFTEEEAHDCYLAAVAKGMPVPQEKES
jgi:hypothetical protein